jgi:predicted secreted protein
VNPVFAIAVFFVIWWTVLFAVLPFAGRSQAEDGAVVPGTPESAPTEPRFLKVILWTTVISALIFGGVFGLINSGLITLVPPPDPA